MLAVFVVLLKDGYQFLVLLINVISFFCEEKKVEYFMLIYCLGIICSCTSTHQLVEKEFNVRQMLYYDLFFYEYIQTVMSKL